jgi:hypothetical protein
VSPIPASWLERPRTDDSDGSANNLNRMRLGPGKHLHGKELFGGAVKGEEFDYFQ